MTRRLGCAGGARKLSEDGERKKPFPIFCEHPKVWLTSASGWWHKTRERYDLCTTEFEKLSGEEKAKYVEVKDLRLA